MKPPREVYVGNIDEEVTASKLISILSTLRPDQPVKIYYSDEDLFYNITEVWVLDDDTAAGIE